MRTVSGGVGFLPLLALLFIGLKLAGCIAWSWWWVLAPLWWPVALVLAVIVCGIPIVLLWAWLATRSARRSAKAKAAARGWR